MHRKEHPAAGAYGDVADGLGIFQDLFECVTGQDRHRREIRVRITAAVAQPDSDDENDQDDEQKQQDFFHSGLLCR